MFLIGLFIFGVFAVTICKNLAIKFNIVDKPDGKLKTHKVPIPATGGLAIISTIFFGVIASYSLELSEQNIATITFLALLFVLGFLDDKLTLGVSIRLVIQIISSIILISYFQPIPLTSYLYIDYIFTTVFFIGCINALNIIDIMDGLAAGIAFFSIFNFIILINDHSSFYFALSISTVVALTSFLIFNFHPAKIYMGDMGSTTLGGMIAVLALVLFEQADSIDTTIHYGLMVLVIFFELVFVVIVRTAKGLNPFRGSPDHMPLRIKKLGLSTKQTVILIYTFSMCVMLFSIAAVKYELSAYITILIIMLVVYMVSSYLLKVRMERLN